MIMNDNELIQKIRILDKLIHEISYFMGEYFNIEIDEFISVYTEIRNNKRDYTLYNTVKNIDCGFLSYDLYSDNKTYNNILLDYGVFNKIYDRLTYNMRRMISYNTSDIFEYCTIKQISLNTIDIEYLLSED